MAIRSQEYAAASKDRLAEAWILLEAGAYSGSIYLAGRAAESILRAHIKAHAKAMKGHNLRALATEANISRRLRSEAQASVDAAIDEAYFMWNNDYRYRDAQGLDRLGRERNVRFSIGEKVVRYADLDHNGLREWAERLFNLSSLIVQEGSRLWHSKQI